MKPLIIVLLFPLLICCKKSTDTITNLAPTISSFSPATAGTGTTVTITGTNFTGTTDVSFGNMAATSFTIVNETTITAIVGAGASGNIDIITPAGSANADGFIFTNALTEPLLKLTVDFNGGTFNPLTYTTGRTDNLVDANPLYSASVTGSQIVYSIPASTLRPKLSGFLDLPQSAGYAPITGDFIHEYTFTNVPQLLALGNNAGSLAIAGCYMRGNYAGANGADWTNGDGFGGFWFGFVKNTNGSRQTVIRSGNTNLISEPFTATNTVTYRIYKKGDIIELFRKYDDAATWTKVGEISLSIRSGGSNAVAITHIRVLNNSDEAATVNADDFKWYY